MFVPEDTETNQFNNIFNFIEDKYEKRKAFKSAK